MVDRSTTTYRQWVTIARSESSMLEPSGCAPFAGISSNRSSGRGR
jgi:hypothetical protein